MLETTARFICQSLSQKVLRLASAMILVTFLRSAPRNAQVPQRTGSATHAVVSLFEDGNNELFWTTYFAMVFGEMVARVKDESALGYVAPPADWPAGIRVSVSCVRV